MKLAIFGAGAIGGTLGAWLAPQYQDILFVAAGETYRAVRENGITIYQEGMGAPENIRVSIVDALEKAGNMDVLVLAVKHYSLEEVSRNIKSILPKEPIIVGLQNGVTNQRILPKYFSRVVYGVIGYNAWKDARDTIGYQKRGPILLGTPDNSLQEEMQVIARIFNLGVKTVVTQRLQDAAHSKLILNLTNSFTTLAGHRYREVDDLGLFQRILSTVLYEGVKIVRAAGYREYRIGGMPPWLFITASAKLPQRITRPLFRRNLKKMVRSSMAQDVIQHRRGQTELDIINGYLVSLADKHGVPAPYNRAVYALCNEEFAKPDFTPLTVREIWDRLQCHMS